jgi:hypothetical protein
MPNRSDGTAPVAAGASGQGRSTRFLRGLRNRSESADRFWVDECVEGGKTMPETLDVDVHELSAEEAWEIIDGLAQHYLGMSGDEFQRAWEAGEFDDDPDRPEVMRVAMLLPSGRANGR